MIIMKPVPLIRFVKYPMINRAIFRRDGIHFIEHDGTERQVSEYKNIEELNAAMRKFGYPEFRSQRELEKELLFPVRYGRIGKLGE